MTDCNLNLDGILQPSKKGEGSCGNLHEEWEVPRNNLSNNTDWLVLGVVELVGISLDNLSVNLISPTSVVSDATSNGSNITLGHGDGLSVVQRLDGGENEVVTVNQVCELEEETTTLVGVDFAPFAIEGITSGFDGGVDIGEGGFVDGGEDFFVTVLQVLLVFRMMVVVWGMRSGAGIGGLRWVDLEDNWSASVRQEGLLWGVR